MGSSGKKRTTMAKFNRESKLREKRVEKQARKEARRREAEAGGPAPDPGHDLVDTVVDEGDLHAAELEPDEARRVG